PGLSGADLAETVSHEGVHRLLTPLGSGAVNSVRQNVAIWMYGHSRILRLAEEFIAESVATGSLIRGARLTTGYWANSPGISFFRSLLADLGVISGVSATGYGSTR
ncbi:MAG: hypothetical protein WBP72_01335, partial [Rhodocyclaceae bacterium]